MPHAKRISDAEHGVTHYCSLSETAEWYAKSETLHTSRAYGASNLLFPKKFTNFATLIRER